MFDEFAVGKGERLLRQFLLFQGTDQAVGHRVIGGSQPPELGRARVNPHPHGAISVAKSRHRVQQGDEGALDSADDRPGRAADQDQEQG